MATLLHGPRLGGPSASGFKVWLRFDGAATCTLETRETGTTAWTLQDTQAVDTSLDNTVVLTAAGLDAKTTYDYQVKADSVVVASSSSMTMPTDERFICYYVSDGHGANQTTYDAVRADWEANYEPLGIPAFILQGGDYTPQVGFTADTIRNWLDTGMLPELAEVCGAGRAGERLPIVYIWDDWDFAGNNSSRNSQLYFSSEADAYVAAQQVWDILWRDHPQPAAPSRSYSFEIANVPFIVVDNRSQRTHRVGTLIASTTGLIGNEPLRDDVSFLGTAHRAWFTTTLSSYRGKGLVFLVTGTTVVDGVGTIHANAARDSIGLSFRAERNYLLTTAWPAAESTKLVILSGDDHRKSFYRRSLIEPAQTNQVISVYDEPGTIGWHNAPDIWYTVNEIKVSSGDSGGVPATIETFGPGNLFEDGSTTPMYARLDITPLKGGTFVTMRVTFVDSTTGSTMVSSYGPSLGHAGDWEYTNGSVAPYAGTQLYPVENSPEPRPVFGLAYIDDVAGTMHTEGDVFRSYDDLYWGALIRAWETYEQEDDRDTLTRSHDRASEATLPLP